MSWDASATLQLLAILGSIASVSMAWYQRRYIAAASHWLRAKTRTSKYGDSGPDKTQQVFELPRAGSWDDPNVEAGAATSAWGEEARRAVEDCCAERACRICKVAKIAEPVKARLRANSTAEVDEAALGRERKTPSEPGARCY